MQNHHCVKVGLVIFILLALLVAGADKRVAPAGMNRNVPPEKHEKQQKQRQGLSDMYSSKRRVPNVSDPLHN
ncbi:hypothetical protein HanIR_Chr09g0435581 [Helianthus annuus]|nr:hypothetical protein HanIR_Chr09g0435581 [Helianthus annuus]